MSTTPNKRIFSGIYAITDTVNGRTYVGQSDNIYRRRKQHFSALKAGKHPNWHLQFDYDVDGHHFVWRILELCDLKELNAREKYWIDELDTMWPHGYNQGWQPYHGRRSKCEKAQTIKERAKSTKHRLYRRTLKTMKQRKK